LTGGAEEAPVKRLTGKPPEQTPFVIILAGQGRRYRDVILARDSDEARDKAIWMAETLTGNFEVQAVRRGETRALVENALPGPEARATDAARDRKSDRAG
jgi:regulator of extracellular matrix RemA (YlzA/DUF370 family)